MLVPLLSTKSTTPTIRSTIVSRQRLIERLNEGKQEKLTLISASAGFGKTTLLSDWSRQSGLPVAWVALDDGDNDATRFWTYIVAALQTSVPHIESASLALLQSSQTLSIPVFLTTLINDLSILTEDIVLVLDDYHVIEEKAIHDGISYLLEHFPPHLHLFIASRVDPPLPLSRLRVRGHIVEIRATDLRFSAEETTIFLTEHMKLHLAEKDVLSLEARTEGWVAGLQLAALSMQGRTNLAGFVQAFTGSHRFILDYLMDEVLHRQPEHIQHFLLQTAVLHKFTAPLCEALTARSDSQTILEHLERCNLFLIPLDDERRWYRYHALFGDVLRVRLIATQIKHVSVLHKKAAIWYEQHNLLAEAIHHALSAQDYSYAADLIEQAIESIWKSGELTTFIGWVQALPEELVRSRLFLCTIYVWVLFLALHTDTAKHFMQHIERVLAHGDEHRPENIEIRGMLAAIQASVGAVRGEGISVLTLSQQALAQIPEEKRLWRIMPAINLGFAYQTLGDTLEAEKAFVEAIQSALAVHNHYFAVVATSGLAITLTVQAKLSQVLKTYQQSQDLADSMGGNIPVAGYISLGLGEIEHERNNLDSATRYFQRALVQGTQWHRTADILLFGYIRLAKTQIAQEDMRNAAQSLSQAQDIIQKIGSTPYSLEAEALQVVFWLAEGNLVAADKWAQQWKATSHTTDYQHESGHIAYVRVCLAQRNFAHALSILSQLLCVAEKQQRKRNIIEILILQALAFDASRMTSQSQKILTRVLSLTEPEGFIRPYLDEGEQMQRMLTALLTESQRTQASEFSTLATYISSLIAHKGYKKFKYTSSLGSTVTGNETLIEPLSEREMDVLRMLASGASNQDIADTLIVTLSTVKKHVGNILNKLMVTSRTQALLRARELHLV